MRSTAYGNNQYGETCGFAKVKARLTSCRVSFQKGETGLFVVRNRDSQFARMTRFYVTVVAVICSITCISAGLGESGDINLANYGVFMKKVGEARLVTNY